MRPLLLPSLLRDVAERTHVLLAYGRIRDDETTHGRDLWRLFRRAKRKEGAHAFAFEKLIVDKNDYVLYVLIISFSI